MNHEISAFVSGVENLLGDELISQDAAQDSQNFYNRDGKIILVPGKTLVGSLGVAGNITGEIFGYRTDGGQVHWRKAGSAIQYDAGTAAVPNWTTVISGLTATADYSFSNYSSQAGAFTFAIGVDGIFKMNNSSPGSYIQLTDASSIYRGKGFIDKGRMILWDSKVKTTLYLSKLDKLSTILGDPNQATSLTISGEATASGSGILAFKAAGAKRNCFNVVITLSGGESYIDNGTGLLIGGSGGTGTINYITGAYTISASGTGTATYQWEDSNANGVTDFSFSPTRVAGDGAYIPQTTGGDPILNVVIGPDGLYSVKQNSAYRLVIGVDDLTFSNNVYRAKLGTQSYRGSLATSQGIVFINTSNLEKPEMTILLPNLAGDSLVPKVLFPKFKFANYKYDDCTIYSYERYILVACKTQTASKNDILLMCDLTAGTVNITNYGCRTFASNAGLLYTGSSISQSIYQLFSGFDDDGYTISNYWIGKGETYADRKGSITGQVLKKYRRLRLRGSISPNQSYQVYLSYDDAGFQLVGTVLGSGTYVDASSPQTIGSSMIGDAPIGGGQTASAFAYMVELKFKKMPKFRKRTIKFVALGIGYVDIAYQEDFDLLFFEQRIPKRFRQKAPISLTGVVAQSGTWDQDSNAEDSETRSWDTI